MILQTITTEMTTTEWILITFLLIMVFALLGFVLIVLLYTYLSGKIHNSYHKGYNRAKDDKIEYYSTLFTLNKKYKEVMNSLKSSEVVLKVSTVEHFIQFENMLKDFQEKN